MLKALYDFKASLPKTLSFREGELFVLLQSNVKQKNWWQVVNANGQVGYIPYNYVASIEVTPQFFREFIDKCLINVDHESESNDKEKETSQGNDKGNSEGGVGDKKEVARKLRERLEALVIDGDGEHSSKRKKAPAPPPPRSPLSCLTTKRTSSSTSLTVSSIPEANCHTEPSLQNDTEKPSKETEKQTEVTNKAPEDGKTENNSGILSGVDLPKITYRLVEEVRHQTHLSHNLSRVAVQVVVEALEHQQNLLRQSSASITSSQSPSSSLLSAVLDLLVTPPPTGVSNFTSLAQPTIEISTDGDAVQQGPSSKSTSNVWWGLRPDLLSESHDGRRLRHLLRELAVVREDEQQRSWAVHEDEIPIIQCVTELISILEDADANVCRLVLCEGGLCRISSLIEYFQMETRWSIRRLLLKAFSIMCDLHRTPTILMLNSVLPMELARDMKSNPKDISRLKQSALLLIRIFSIGEAMPIYHFEHLGEDFISFLLDRLEEEVELKSELGKEEDEIPDLFLTLLLAYNLQFKEQSPEQLSSSEESSETTLSNPVANPVLNVLKNQTCAKALTEKALLLVNREEDPVGIYPSAHHATVLNHSVIKLVGDLFGDIHTAALFYTNDTKVLIDILVRQLSDLSPGDQRRGQWLWLCRRVLRNCGYGEHLHRRDDLARCFTRIFCEDTASSSSDQHLVRDIINEFPMFFKV